MQRAEMIEDIGGASVVKLIARNFLMSVIKSAELSKHFRGLAPARLIEIENRLTEFLTAQLGGDFIYKGAPINEVMARMSISKRDWTTAMGCMLEAIKLAKVPSDMQTAFMAAITSLEDKALSGTSNKKRAAN